MKCYICSGKGKLIHLDRNICSKCLVRNVEKRVKKHLGRKLFKKGDYVLVVGKLEEVLLKAAVGDLPLNISIKDKVGKFKSEKYDKIVVGVVMDEIEEKFLSELFSGKMNLGKNEFFNILEPLTREEVKLYCKVKGLAFDLDREKSLGGEFLNKLKEFKEIKYNIYKNIKELRALVS